MLRDDRAVNRWKTGAQRNLNLAALLVQGDLLALLQAALERARHLDGECGDRNARGRGDDVVTRPNGSRLRVLQSIELLLGKSARQRHRGEGLGLSGSRLQEPA